MKNHKLISTLALLGFVLAACHKTPTASEPTAAKPQVPAETRLHTAYGFAAQVPANEDGYVAFYGLGRLWHDFKASKMVASILANPLFHQPGGAEVIQGGLKQLRANPEGAKWLDIVKDALGNETFLVFAPGSAARFKAFQQVVSEMRVAQFKAALAGKKGAEANRDAIPAVLSQIKTLHLPPMIFGFKLASQKAALGAELERAEKNLPPGVELTTFQLNDAPFKLIAITVSKVLPPAQQEELRGQIARTVSDPAAADDIFKSLLARHFEIAYGFVGDYFVASIGADHSHLKLASNLGESLLSRPEVAVVANYADKPLVTFSWSSAEFIAAAQNRIELTPLYERIKADLTKTLAPADVQKLESDLHRLDEKGHAIFGEGFTPMVGVCWREHGLRSEAFGGLKIAAAQPLKFSGVPADSTFLWIDAQSNPSAITAFWSWFEDVVTTGYDTFQRLGVPALQETEKAQFGMFQQVAVPKLTELYRISREQFGKSLGNESAFALDLGGEVPELPMLPPAFHQGGRMLRLAYISDVTDRALLGQSWDSYLKLARDVALMIPQTAQLPGGLPSPKSETVEGVTLAYYPLPMPTGDLLPNVATTDKTFVVSTSRSYALEASKAAAKPASDPKALKLDFRMNFKAAFDFADKWLALAMENPEPFFQGDANKVENFKKNAPNLAALLKSLRAFEGMDMQVFEENGQRRVSSAVHWNKQ